MFVIAPTLIAAGVIALLIVLETILVEPRLFRVRRDRVACARGSLSRPIRILHISDLHFRRWERSKTRFLRRLAQQEEVDLVAITGDLADLTPAIPACVAAIREFKPRHGVFVCLGGHDYFRTTGIDLARQLVTRKRRRFQRVDTDRLVAALREAGIVALVNARVELDVGGTKVDVIGIDDYLFGQPDLDAAFDGARADAFKLVLMHEPSMVEELARRGPDLVLHGHTHGGQVRIPGVGALVTQSRLSPKLASGVFEMGRTTFHLNHGVGTGEHLPFRMFCRPEASVLEIVGRAEEEADKG